MEYYDILDEEGRPTGRTAARREVHARGLLHGAAHLWIFNSRGEILLQKRAPGKDSHPGLWDVSVAGHIDAGEEPETAAVREALEEIGLIIEKWDLELHRKRTSLLVSGEGSFVDREIVWVYLLRREEPAERFHPRPGEVSSIRWFDQGELRGMLAGDAVAEGGGCGLLVPHDLNYYLDILNRVRREV